MQNEYLRKFGKEITLDVISKELRLSKEEIAMAMESTKPITSIEESSYRDNKTDRTISILEKIDAGCDESQMISDKLTIKELINNLDNNAKLKTKENMINRINEEISHNYKVHEAITHYKDNYGYIPPFVLMKILTFGVTSSYYGLLKQTDRQAIAKYFKISDKLLKQILKNLTSIRNIAAHSDWLFCFRDKYTLSFKTIDKNYVIKDNATNIYMML